MHESPAADAGDDDGRLDRRITVYLPARLRAQYVEEAQRRHIRLGRLAREKLMGEGDVARQLADTKERLAESRELVGHLKALVESLQAQETARRIRGGDS